MAEWRTVRELGGRDGRLRAREPHLEVVELLQELLQLLALLQARVALAQHLVQLVPRVGQLLQALLDRLLLLRIRALQLVAAIHQRVHLQPDRAQVALQAAEPTLQLHDAVQVVACTQHCLTVAQSHCSTDM